MTTSTTEPFDLRRARLNAGHSIRGLARKLQISEQTIRRLESGERVSPENAKPVADYFGITVLELVPDLISEPA